MPVHVLGLLADRLPRRPTFRPRGTVGPRAPLALVAHDPQHWCTAIYDMLDSSYLNTQTLQNRVHRKIDRTRIHADISARSLCHVRHGRSEAYGGNEFSSGGRGAQPHNRPCPCSSLWFSAAQRIMPCGPGAAACTGSGRTLQRSSLLRAESGVVRSLPRPTMKPFCTACARSSSAPGEWLRKTALDLLLAPTARGAERGRQDVGCRS